MQTTLILSAALLKLVAPFPAYAQDAGLIQEDKISIQSDLKEFRGQTFYMGIDYLKDAGGNSTREAVGMYFKNTFRTADPCTGKMPKFYDHFTFQQLTTPQVVIQTKKDESDCSDQTVYKIVRMQKKGRALIISYQPDARYDQWRSQTFLVNGDSQSGFKVVEETTGREVTHIIAITHKYMRMFPSGIDRLVVQ